MSASKTLYWRVQAQDENNNGLTWSETRTFEIDLEQPTLDPATPTLGDASLPVLRWFPVPGAVSYSLRIHEPNDTTPNTYTGYPVHGGLLREDHRDGPLHLGDPGRLPEAHRRHDARPLVRRRRLHAHDQGAHEPGVERAARTASS